MAREYRRPVNRRVRHILSYPLLGVVALLAMAAPLHAQSTDAAVNSLLGELRAQGDGVDVGSSEILKGSGDVRLNDLKVTFPKDKDGASVQLSFSKLELSGVHSDANHIAIGQARAEHALLILSGGKVALGNLSVDQLSLPRLNTTAGAGAQPIQTLVGAFDQILRTELSQLSIEDFSWERSLGSNSLVTVARMAASDVKGGNIAKIGFSGVKSTDDATSRITSVDSLTLERLNPGLIADILKFDRSTAEPRDWKVLAGTIAIGGLVQTQKTNRISVPTVQFSGLRLRPFASDPSKFFDLASTNPTYFREHPEEARKFAEAFLDVIKLDHASLNHLEVTDGQEPTPRRFGVDTIDVADLDPLNASAITLTNITDQRGDNGLKINRIALTKLELVSPAAKSANAPPAPKIPFFGGLSIEGAKFVQPGGFAELQSFNWSAPERIGIFPAKLTASIVGLSLPASLIPNPPLRASFETSGVTSLAIDADVSANWDVFREQVELEQARLNIGKVGQLEFAGTFGDMPKSASESLESFRAALFSATVSGIRVRYSDAGLVKQVLELISSTNKQPVDQIRKAITGNMPSILGPIADATVRNSFIFALVGFLNDPQILEITSLNQSPVRISDLSAAALGGSLEAIPGLLKLRATATRAKP